MTLDSFINTKKPIPEFKIGQVVKARNRFWRIERIINQKSEFDKYSEINLLEVSTIDGVPNRCCLLHSSIKMTDGKKEIKKLEEIKLAKIPRPDVNKLGNPDFQKILIQAMRFDLIFGTSSFISLANSRVIPVSYQMVPVLMAMAQEKVRLLIADDVGLGKTIEAGLIIQELLGRRKINRVLYVVPASLREQWQLIMQRFFGLDVRIISNRSLGNLQKELLVGGDPWGYFNFLIVSQDYLSRQEMLERATQFNFDMVVIDEAHNVAKPRYMMQPKGQKKSKRLYGMAERVADKYPHILLLTATPHNGYHESFASLIHLLNPSLVDERNSYKIDKALATRFICQRKKEDVKAWMGESEMKILFPNVHRKEVFIPPIPEFKEIISKIDEYAAMIFETAKVDKKGVRYIKYWAILHMYRRYISCPYSLIKTIQNKLKDDTSSETEIQDVNKLPEEEIQEQLERTRQNVTDISNDDSYEEHEIDRNNDTEPGRKKLSPKIVNKLLEIENSAKNLIGYSNDVKLNHFYNNVLQDLIEVGNKIIIFTRYIDTADYLADELKKLANEKSLLKGFEIVEIVGTDAIHIRAEKYDKFLALNKGIMVSTDCMSEGIDLQYSSNIVVNYELTWNPNRLEQRNGRVDRFGQPKKDVYIRTLIMKESLEIAILDLLYKKIQSIGADVGYEPKYFGNLDLIGDVVDDYFKKTNTIRFGKREPEVEYISLDYFIGQDSESEMKKLLKAHINPNFEHILSEDSFYGQTTVDFSDVQERMKEMQESIGDIMILLGFLQKALPFFNSSIEVVNAKGYPPDKVYKIILSKEIQELIITSEKSKEEYYITIDPIFGAKNTEIETLSLKSPVIYGVINLVKEQGFISEDKDFYGRTAAASTSLINEVSAIIYYKIRYLVKTRETSMMEELHPIGIKIFDESIDNGGNPLVEQKTTKTLWNKFISGQTSNYPGLDKTVQNDMNDLFTRPDFEKIIEKAVNDRLVIVKNNAKGLMKKLEKKNLAAIEELRGMDDIEIISYDPISITTFYPPR
ncbi:MAG: helicase-related protein [Promethearchaeota archaeon]